MTVQPRWLGLPARPLMGWLHMPPGGCSESGVLVLPPVGYQYWTSHRTLRVVAERLAAAGHLALRLDYDGTGDSAGDQADPDRVTAWRRSVEDGVRELRELGAGTVLLVGVRLGATLALLEAARLGAGAVVAWAPVVQGRRYARELRLLGTPVPAEHDPVAAGGTLVAAGSVFTADTLASLARLDLLDGEEAPPGRVTLVEADAGLADVLRRRGAEVEVVSAPDGEQALERPAEYATVPEAVVRAIGEAVGEGTPTAAEPPAACRRAQMTWAGKELEEEVVTLGAGRLVGVLTRAAASESLREVVVFLNSGSEPHVGPGRAWVEYARGLAVRGHTCLRVDFRGWGESPDDGRAPGRPYDPHTREDVLDLVDALMTRGHSGVVVAGLCAGAWVGLRAALECSLAGVVALNPQLYWRPGDPVEALMSETRARRTPEREREERGARSGVWTSLDELGDRPWAAEWLDALRDADVPVLMLFAEGDDGLEYLHNRFERRLRSVAREGRIVVDEVPAIDHSMHRTWLRGEILERIDRFLRGP